MFLMTGAEFILWCTAGFVFWRKALHRKYRAMSGYLALRVASTPVLFGLLYLQAQPWARKESFVQGYFYAYWAVYAASVVLLYFICLEVFRAILSGFAGLKKLGIVAFRWVALVSLLMSLISVPLSHGQLSGYLACDLAAALMRGVSILMLCLLTFLALSMNALHLSVRNKAFGISLGFGMMSAGDFIVSTLSSRDASLTSPTQFLNEFLILVTLGMWSYYFAVPEPVTAPVVVAANSTIYRWNEIASALGHGTQVAVPQPARSFFLSDVEKVVDKVLARNLQSETKS
jgi:hypothetical protein